MSNNLTRLPKSATSLMNNPEGLAQRMETETQIRQQLTDYISKHMVEGADYGRIHISRNCENKYACTYEKNPSHFSKPSLFKPGSEKFCSLFHLHPTFERDEETWVMAGSVSGLFCYKCILKDSKANIVGEGRGSARLDEKREWTVNNAVKIAEKRAQIDAVLRTGGLSDFFTQDLEDMAQETEKAKQEEKKVYFITPYQKQKIAALVKIKGKDFKALAEYIYKKYGVEDPQELELPQANEVIAKLESMPDHKAEQIQEGEVVEQAPDVKRTATGVSQS